MKYSVVIPMYNSEMTIRRTIESVINQSRFDLIDEIIVVNDGSTDSSEDQIHTLMSCEKKIRLINKHNSGAASARNEGIKAASNNMIALLDADDEWLPRKIERQNEILETYRVIRALGSNRVGESVNIGTTVFPGVKRIFPKQYCLKCWPCTPSLVFDKSLFNDESYFPEDMTHAEEGLFFLKLSHDYGLYYSLDELVLCGGGKRAYGVSGLSGDIKKMHKGFKTMLKKAGSERFINPLYVPLFSFIEDAKYLRRKLVVGKLNG